MTPVPQSRASEAAVPVRLWRCPECKAEAFWPAEPLLPGGPALCGHPSSGYVSTLYVPAALSEELVEKVARAASFSGVVTTTWREVATDALRAAGFVSEPSTGGE